MKKLLLATLTGGMLVTPVAQADIVHADDVIIQGSLNVGFDAVSGKAFGFDTIILSENNLRIFFEDTSNSASFPTNDWRIVINDTSNGGGNFFAVEDTSNSRVPFKITAAAPTNSMFVSSAGNLGLGTGSPVVEVHVVDGDTPTLRLEQDGSSGFTPQTWDVAGNETNFFVRDVTGGSKLPLRIRPGAPSNSIFVDTDGDVGMGTSSPAAALHVNEVGGSSSVLLLQRDGNLELGLKHTGSATDTWRIRHVSGGQMVFGTTASNNTHQFDPNGNMVITGQLTTATTTYPDYVFAKDYKLMPLNDLAKFIETNKHLPDVATAEEVKRAGGVNVSVLQVKLLEKVEELTLYTLQQQKMIDDLRVELAQQKAGRN